MSAPTTSRSSLIDLNTTTLDRAARIYASMGWPVIPLRPRNKQPANSNGLTGASTDLDQIDEWWKRWPQANIGLRTGDAFDVLDLDSMESQETLQKLILIWQMEQGTPITKYRHPGPIQATGKGLHLLFEPTGARNFANRYPGIDFRGQRGYIVASPSIHPSGHRYRWLRDEPLSDAPGWLLELLIPERTRPPQSQYAPEDLAPIARVWDETFGATDEWKLQPLGSRFVARCPWHDDSTPSLVLYPENNSFFCFGCNEWGDTIDVGDSFPLFPQSPSQLRALRPSKSAAGVPE